MSLIQKYLALSEASFPLTLLIQLVLVSAVGFIVVKAISRRSAPLRSLIALFAMFSLALTFALSTAFHFSNISWYKQEKVNLAESVTFNMRIAPVVPTGISSSDINMTVPRISVSRQPEFEVNWEKVSMAVGIIWVAGTILMLLQLVYGLVFLNGFKYGLTPVNTPHFNVILKVVALKFGRSKTPVLHSSSRVESPITLGVSKPVVILPERLLDKLSDNEMKSILFHELAHIYSRDHLAGIFKRIIIAANWWNPLVYIISAEHSSAREEVSDNHVLQELCPRTYSECLIGLAEKTCLINRFPAAAGMAGKHSRLEQRIKNILSKKRKLLMKTTKWMKTATVLACTVVTITIAGVQYASAQDASSPEADGHVEKNGNSNGSQQSFDSVRKNSNVYVVIEPKLGRIRLNNTDPNAKLAYATLMTSGGGFFKVSDISIKNKGTDREFIFKITYMLEKKAGSEVNQTVAVKYSELPKQCLQAGKWTIWVKREDQQK